MGQKDRTLHNGRTEIHGLAVFHELLEQSQDLLVHRRNPSCCKVAKILRNDYQRPLCFTILAGNVSSVIENFNLINNRPRKCLNFLTFFEVLQKFFSDHVALDLTIYQYIVFVELVSILFTLVKFKCLFSSHRNYLRYICRSDTNLTSIIAF